jgi:hypothetical protein
MVLVVLDRVLSGVFSACRNVFVGVKVMITESFSSLTSRSKSWLSSGVMVL